MCSVILEMADWDFRDQGGPLQQSHLPCEELNLKKETTVTHNKNSHFRYLLIAPPPPM